MKRILCLLLCVAMCLGLVACTGEQGADGGQGDAGQPGLSAYEIYLKYHPEYTGSEEEWIEEIYSGKLPLVEVDFSELTYVAFGDSITYGVDGVLWVQMEKPYPTLVNEQLGFKDFRNLGVSGATLCSNSLGLTNMTQSILDFDDSADIISILLGVNDFARDLPLGNANSTSNTTIYGSLFLIADYLTTYYSNSYIFFMTPFPCKNDSKLTESGYLLDDVCAAIKYIAGLFDIDVLDLNNVSGYENYVNLGDGLHPSQDYFIEHGAPIIADFIKENYSAN